MPGWIGEFYAYYQWYYDVSSSELVKKVPVSFLMKTYAGLGGLDLDLAVPCISGSEFDSQSDHA